MPAANIDPPLQLLTPTPPQPQRPLFIFLPGMDGTGQLLRTQLSGLSQGFDIRCLALSVQNNWPWPQLVDQTLQLLRPMIQAVPRPAVYLCGESFGGCLALQLATHAPELFSHLVLVNPASSFHRLPWMQWGASFSQWLPGPLYRVSNMGLMPFLIQQRRVTAAAREALWESMTAVPASTALWRVALLGQFKAQQLPLEHMPRPTLLIAGEADALLPSVAEVRQLGRRLPDAQILTLPESGHACLLERDVNLYALMADAGFLEPMARAAASSDSLTNDSLYSNEGSKDNNQFVTSGS
ncbi:MAG: alpha/beta hydrolase [Cyanobacteria bacterium J06626_23]